MLDCQSFHLPSMSRQKKAEHRSAARATREIWLAAAGGASLSAQGDDHE
jgi:hypothetical protein